MFSKIGRNGGQVTWSITLADGETLAVSGKWYSTDYDSTVYVTVMSSDSNELIERRGKLVVERAVSGPIFFAKVGSINGDVTGEGRNVKTAVEDFVSKVAQAVVEQRRQRPEAELVEELLDTILTEWRKSTRTSASAVERKAIEIVNLRAVR